MTQDTLIFLGLIALLGLGALTILITAVAMLLWAARGWNRDE
jgi:hypothetical protein